MLLFEDERLLAVNKPPGLNTHSPAPFAGEGLYEWLRSRHPSRARLAILHRLDKDTSGVIVFGKSPEANRSLVQQFERRAVRKTYFFLTDRSTAFTSLTVRSWLRRDGNRYRSLPSGQADEEAVTEFSIVHKPELAAGVPGDCRVWEARPLTGRTHQIRAQAAARGFPILGDVLYGGTPAPRVCLHAARLVLRHPITGKELLLEAPADFGADPRWTLRQAIIDPAETDAFRLIHGAADGWPGLKIDRLGQFLLAQSAGPLTHQQRAQVEALRLRVNALGACHQIVLRRTESQAASASPPKLLCGEAAPAEIEARENGLRFALRLEEGLAPGLFLDQRENRRRLLTGYIAPGFTLEGPRKVLNLFAYTCGFSVAAAAGGAQVASLDLSHNYLAWGRRNFVLNNLDPGAHEFIRGDAFDWLRRLARKGRQFDVVILDPPTFSRSKEHGVFQVVRDYPELVEAALPVLRRGGIMLASTNAATLAPEDFLNKLSAAITHCRRAILQQYYAPQPPDFPVSRDEPAYLKTVWLRVS